MSTTNPLAKLSDGGKEFKRMMLRSASTDAQELETRRAKIAEYQVKIQILAAKMLEAAKKKDYEEYQQLNAQASTVQMLMVSEGVAFQADCLCLRVRESKKNIVRASVAALTADTCDAVDDLGQVLASLHEMVEELGLALGHFRDANGVPTRGPNAPQDKKPETGRDTVPPADQPVVPPENLRTLSEAMADIQNEGAGK